jgi:predicted NBD/HSP70 family sugar kinase
MRGIDLNNFRVASSETARDINRRTLLNLVHQHQPVSRASLARMSGMQRSTVSAITGQLISERWLIEGAVGHLPRGRKPTFLHLNSDRASIIGVEIHPATTTLAVSTMDMRILAQESIPTGRNPDQFIEQLGRRINDLTQAHPKNSYEGIGISLPGRVDLATRWLAFAPSLNWNDVDFKSPLEKVTGLRVELENAANACALAEVWSGRLCNRVSHLVVVTVSESIGVGMVMNGQLLRGSQGISGEFGHVSLSAGGPVCACGNHGCWEIMASNTAAVRYYGEFSGARLNDLPPKNNARPVSFPDLLLLVEQGDVKAGQALDQMAGYLGVGLALLVTGLAPDVLVVVGDITRVWNRVNPIVENIIRRRSFTNAPTRIVATDSENHPRLRGAVALIAHKHLIMPQI